MTKEEAIDILVGVIATNSEEENEALDIAIEALEEKKTKVICDNDGCKWSRGDEEMNAVEFLKLQKRICKQFGDSSCPDCPLYGQCLTTSTNLDYDEEDVVDIAETWAAEHPLRTNGDAITQMLDENLPWEISGIEYEKRFRGDDVILTFSKEMWNEEYKGKYGADGCEGCKWDYLMPSDDPCCDCCHSFKSNWEYKYEV